MKFPTIACCFALGAALMAAGPLVAGQKTPQTKGSAHPAARQGAAAQNEAEEEGQRVFEQNCARCHNAPEGFSPQITGTVVRHMRVRANLSRHDEEVLLHYFNP